MIAITSSRPGEVLRLVIRATRVSQSTLRMLIYNLLLYSYLIADKQFGWRGRGFLIPPLRDRLLIETKSARLVKATHSVQTN